MRLIVPHIGRIDPRVLEPLAGLSPELHRVRGPDGYYRLLLSVWEGRDDLVIVEHDIVTRPGCVEELRDCPEDWCKFQYPYPPYGLYGGLGCTKFSRALQREFPESISLAGTWYDDWHPPRHWCRIDGWLRDKVLLRLGVVEHIHTPPVIHLSERTDHRCDGQRRHADIPEGWSAASERGVRHPVHRHELQRRH